MQKKWIFLTGLLLLVLAAIWLYNSYQQPRENIVEKDVEYSLTADELYNAFKLNEEEASKKYVDKVLIVRGTVKEVLKSEEQLSIKLKCASVNGCINADFDKRQKDPKIFNGNTIKIKGRCTGFLSDVYLVDCIIEN